MNFIQKVVVISLIIGSHSAFADYDYPIKNAITATIVGTPEALKITPDDLLNWQPYYVKMPVRNAQFKRSIEKSYKISIFPDRAIPDVFWYEKGGLRYSIAQHKVQAPMIFIIAGTGASYNSSTVKDLQQIYYQIGYHVVSISSPTIPNFMYNASSSVMPGNLLEDSQDIYHVMQRIMEKHNDIPVSDYYLTGYSLGASHAAFVTLIDDQNTSAKKKSFQFQKTLLINPPLSLVNSVDVLDRMFEENIPGGIEHFNDFFERFIHKASTFYRENEELGVGKEFFYEIFKEQPPTEKEMKVMIGFVFRISSAGMIFGADVFNHQGYIVPKNQVNKLSSSSILTHYAKIAHRLGFNDYIKQFYLPVFEKKTGLSAQELIDQSSLEAIKMYLQNTNKIGLMHNADDPILVSGEIDTLETLFPGRAKIYPSGGHMGNIQYKQNVLDMIAFFDNKEQTNRSPIRKELVVTGEMQ
jgi:hypothetical protein